MNTHAWTVVNDETLARSYYSQLKRQSNVWSHIPTNVKFMVILVYDYDGVILTHIVLQNILLMYSIFVIFWGIT
ncbi:hypothetical protein ANN_09353 [Periplaneta americana]|uniref:Uncharacterized protein n=1 Tax=Periplaneta americana TaxID=6978 RepID=A0ABQ8TNB3_PERAM|nr:hypothetical protein ANN_09353 [Periplaneta americana]